MLQIFLIGKSVHESNLDNFMYFSFIVSAPERYTKPLAFIIMNQQTSIKFFRIMLIENKFSIYDSE